ncbi:MAG: hypothetical protein K2K74_06985 [Lachnospiraceae bacterium]|nr:hypothetical protein [Lachnospiraceae bacterium]
MGRTRINDEQYQHMAYVWGLNYDMENKVIYGERSGYPFLIYASNALTPLMFTITTSAVSSFFPPIGNMEENLLKSRVPMLTSVGQRDSRITALSTNTFDLNTAQQNVECILSVLISFLQERGYIPCCESCKYSVHTEILQTRNEYRHLCPQCEERIAASIWQNMPSVKASSANVVKGIIGTVIGAALGFIFMALLSSYTYIDNVGTLLLSGLMAGTFPASIGVCMGGRPCRATKIVIAVIVVLTVFVGYNAGFVVAFMTERDMSVWMAAKTYISMMLAGMANMKLWTWRLAVAYVAAAAGGFSSYLSASSKFRNPYKVVHIGRYGR